MSDTIWLIIPAYNVGKYLNTLLTQSVFRIPAERTVVVDDGSSDETAEIAGMHGVWLLRHQGNMGKGLSLRDGLDYVAGKGGEWVITMDGDCQHDPAIIPEFIKAGESGKFDIIIGSRRRSGTKMPWDRRLSNKLSSLLISLVSGQKMEDVQCGYRMIRMDSIKDIIFTRDKYDFEMELLLKMIRKGARVGWVDIPTRYNGAPSSIRRLPDTLRFLKIVSLYLRGEY